jgi:hypothetical protein
MRYSNRAGDSVHTVMTSVVGLRPKFGARDVLVVIRTDSAAGQGGFAGLPKTQVALGTTSLLFGVASAATTWAPPVSVGLGIIGSGFGVADFYAGLLFGR